MKYLMTICMALMLLLVGCDNKAEIKAQPGDEFIGTWELVPKKLDDIKFTISREQDKLIGKMSSTVLATYKNKKLLIRDIAVITGELSYDDQTDTLHDLIKGIKFARISAKPESINTSKELEGEEFIGLWNLEHDDIPPDSMILKIDKEGDKFRLTVTFSNELRYDNGALRGVDIDGTLGIPMIYNKETDTLTGEAKEFNMKVTFRRVTN